MYEVSDSLKEKRLEYFEEEKQKSLNTMTSCMIFVLISIIGYSLIIVGLLYHWEII